MKLTLSQVIDRLRKESPTKVIKNGWGAAGSWRGSYDEIAFSPLQNVTIASMLDSAEQAIGQTMRGYKGGDFYMDGGSLCNVACYGNYGEERDELTKTMLEEMLSGEHRPDLHHRIGTLEGAIKGAILQLESNVECFEACDRIWLKEYDDKTRQVIANLKELIVEK